MLKYILFHVLAFTFAINIAKGFDCKSEGGRPCVQCGHGKLKNCHTSDRCKIVDGRCKEVGQSCFPGNSVVTTEAGDVIKMSDVKIGDRIASVSTSGGYIFSEVRAFMHREEDVKTSYLRLETSSGKDIVLSHSHVLFMGKSNKSSDMANKFAEEVEIGDYIFHADQSSGIIPEMVISKSLAIMEGAYAPLTTEGTLLVNGLYASCYAAISHNIAHIAMTPMRWFPWILDSDVELQGARPFVNFMKNFGIYILPDQYKTSKYKSADQEMISLDKHPLAKCAAIKQNYNIFAVNAAFEK